METLKNKAIGVMDSGVGGLTVLKQLVEIAPNENYLYFGDTKNLPYGEKSKDELISIAKKVFDFYAQKQVKAVVMACNTTSATVYDELKDNYDFKIYPIIQVVSKILAQDNKLNRVAIMATKATVNSHKYRDEFLFNNPKINVFEHACPMWVPVVENKLVNYDKNDVITQYLDAVLAFEPQKVVLGCTHYPYLLDELSKFASRDLFVNPSKLFADFIINDLAEMNLLTDNSIGSVEYFASSDADAFKKNARLFMTIDDKPELVLL